MIDIRAVVRALLLSDPAVSAAVGGSRIYPSILPQGVTDPSIVQNVATEFLRYHMGGDDNFMQTRMQLGAWAKTSDQAVALAGVVFDKLSGYRGPTPYGSGTAQIGGVLHTACRDDYDNAAKLYVRSRDYFFWHEVR